MGRTLARGVGLAIVLAVGIHAQALGECVADVDQDGVVDGGDVAAVAAELGTTDCIPADRFQDNGDGTITDFETGLMWEKKTVGNVGDTFTWVEAFEYVHGVSATAGMPPSGTVQGLGGFRDWRVPTHTELQTILLDPCPGSPDLCIDPVFGPTGSSSYWSSATRTNMTSNAWTVNFFSGNVVSVGKDGNAHVRAVRGGQ